MTAAAEGAVEESTAWARLQCGDRFREEHRPVAGY